MHYQDFLAAAEEAYSQAAGGEAGLRSSIHLAYYAAYHACCESLRAIHGKPELRLSHADVVQGAKDHKLRDKRLWAASRRFPDLRYLRFKADYHLTARVSLSEADDAIDAASAIIHAS